MPRNPNLLWTEVKDFTKGLFTIDEEYLVPATGFVVMEDCYPQVDGGLRAFYKPTASTTTGLTSTDRVMALESWASPVETTFMLLSVDPGAGTMTAWRRDLADSSWTSSKVFATPGAATGSTFGYIVPFVTITNRYFAVSVAQASGGGDTGVWLYDLDADSWALALNADVYQIDGTPMTMYQNRLIARANSSFSPNTALYWTDPGDIIFQGANVLELPGRRGDTNQAISALVPFNPSTLLVGTAASSWITIAGDIDDPIVTDMGMSHSPNIAHSQQLAVMDDGVAFIDANAGLYLAQNMGATAKRLDPQLTPYNPAPIRDSFGTLLVKDFLFAPGGRVLYTPTNSWFSLSEGTGANDTHLYHATRFDSDGYDDFTSDPSVYAPQWKDSFKINKWVLDDALDASARYDAYTAKTAPLRAPNAVFAAIDEVEVFTKSHTNGSSISVTVNGTTRTVTADAGEQMLRFRFRERADYLDATFVAASNNSSYEAPTIESFRIGTRKDAHQLR